MNFRRPHSRLLAFAYTCWFAFVGANLAHAQYHNSEILSTTAPTGTTASPAWVIDSDVAGGAGTANRHKISVSASVKFSLAGGAAAVAETFHLKVRLLDADNDPITLSNGNTVAYSPTKSIQLPSGTLTETMTAEVIPGVDLGSGQSYRAEVTVERRLLGLPPFTWVVSSGPVNSSSFVIEHFRNASPGNEYWVRGYPTGTPTWTRTHRIATVNARKTFTATVPYRLARYAPGSGSASITVRLKAVLSDSSGNPIALKNDGVTTTTITMNAVGTPLPSGASVPYVRTGSFSVAFEPNTQLNSPGKTYNLRIEIEHIESLIPVKRLLDGTSPATSNRPLLDFNGNVVFGNPNGVTGVLTAISGTPPIATPVGSAVPTSITPIDGFFPGTDTYFGNVGGTLRTLSVNLLANGDAVVTDGFDLLREDLEADYNGMKVQYKAVKVSASGVVADTTTILLPQGLSFTPDRATSSLRYKTEIEGPGNVSLNSDLQHSGDLSLILGSDAWIFDESRPIEYKVSNVSLTQDGTLAFFTGGGSHWIHKESFDLLDQNEADGLHDNLDMSQRPTNEGYLRYANQSSIMVTFKTAADGTAQTQAAQFYIGAGNFVTHFPKDVSVSWVDQSFAEISDGSFTAASMLESAGIDTMAYQAGCPGADCGPPGGVERSLKPSPTGGIIHLTPEGGLYAQCNVTSTQLRWGYKGASEGDYTHRTGNFLSGQFYASGNQLSAEKNPLREASALKEEAEGFAPAVLMLAGYDSATRELSAPETTSYRAGTGVYPGINLTVTGTTHSGASRLADMNSALDYHLENDGISKYYVRKSGVSGRHVARDGSFDPGLMLYGYAFTLDRFQFTYLSNENVDSWTDGKTDVPYPSDFSQNFKSLLLSCTGALEGAQIDPDDPGPKTLSYWNGLFSPLSLSFRPQESDPACDADRFLTLGLTSTVANIEGSLAGTLAFFPDGNIATAADAVVGADGRLGLPASLYLTGPGEKTYQLNPTGKLYFNNYADANAPGIGFVSFAATCQVPFFEALKVHATTSARADIPAPIYLAAGWTESGNSFFTDTYFDSTHRGLPSGVTQNQYQSPQSSSSPYLIRAHQSLFGAVDLTYPLNWNSNARYFTSSQAANNDLFVINIDHQVDYLDSQRAEISFGAQYEGLPKINLVNAAIDVAGEPIGAFQAIADATDPLLAETFSAGTEKIDRLLSDNPEELYTSALDRMVTNYLNPLFAELTGSAPSPALALPLPALWAPSPGGSVPLPPYTPSSLPGVNLEDLLDTYIGDPTAAVATGIRSAIEDLTNPYLGDGTVIHEIIEGYEGIILQIDALIGELYKVQGNKIKRNPSQAEIEKVIRGIFFAFPVGEDRASNIYENLVFVMYGLGRSYLASHLADRLFEPLNDPNSEERKMLDKFIKDFGAPAIEICKEALLAQRTSLVLMQDQFKALERLSLSLQSILDDSEQEIEDFIEDLRERAREIDEALTLPDPSLPPIPPPPSVSSSFPSLPPMTPMSASSPSSAAPAYHPEEWSQEEFVDYFRARIRDFLISSNFTAKFQRLLREELLDATLSTRSQFDSLFAVVNDLMRQFMKGALGPIDDTVNGLLGDLNDVFGAGSLDGYAHIQGDSLKRLRLDGELLLKVPDDLKMRGFFEINCFDSSDEAGACINPGEMAVEVTAGAVDTPLGWISPDLRGDFTARFSLKKQGGNLMPTGIGGALEMTSGSIDFQGMTIKGFAAGVGAGIDSCYLAATARIEVSDYEAAGGIFFGKTCSIDPLKLVDPDVASVLGNPPFTGAYVYGETWLPISEALLGIPASCLFRISAGVGAGAFYFAEGPTYGGKMMLGVSGEALCVVSVSGDVTMVGAMTDQGLRYRGTGRISGKAGWCPVCVRFGKSATLTYQSGGWSVDF